MRKGKYAFAHPGEQKFAFWIEDPIDIAYNVGYTVLQDGKELEVILFEFQRAYKSIANKDLRAFEDGKF